MRPCNAQLRTTALSVALATLVAMAGAAPSDERVISRHFTAADQQAQRYAYVPIDVPAGTTRMSLEYQYDTAGGVNAIDLGLFEPGPLTLESPAFRGWSGGGRNRITVGVDEATPGYWPGPLSEGQWHAVLGLYKVGPSGVDVAMTTHVSQERLQPPAAVAPRINRSLRRGPAWYVGITHAHTTESDGVLSTTDLIEQARAEGLDFLAITDHNNTTHQLAELDRPDLLVISGEEVTTPAGHFNVWGLGGPRDFVEFRIPAGDPALSSVMDTARRRGAVVSINHPASDCLACTWTHAIPDAVEAVEIANGTAVGRQQAMAIWDTLLRGGRRIAAVEGRDWHRGPEPLGTPALRVWAPDLSTLSILDAIRHGRSVVVDNARLPAPELTLESAGRAARIGDTLTVEHGQVVHIVVTTPPPYRSGRVEWAWNGEAITSTTIAGANQLAFEYSPASSGYARVHVLAADGRPLAVTNPVFVTVR